jgi:hypothetical protein
MKDYEKENTALHKPEETTGNEVATLDTIIARFRAAASQAGDDPVLKFVKGQYTIGDDEVRLGTEHVAHGFDVACGRVKFRDKKVVSEKMRRCARRFRFNRSESERPLTMGSLALRFPKIG